MKKYAKFIDENTIQEAPLIKDGSFFNYNSDANEPMLLADGYLPVVISDEEVAAPQVKMKYRLESNQIVAYWAEVPLDVEVLRASKLDTIKSVYESQRNYGVAEYQGMSFSIHETAKQNLTASVLLAQTLGGNIDYCEADGTPHSFTLEEFKPIIQVISEAIKALEFKFYQLERQIKSATTIEDLRAITWE